MTETPTTTPAPPAREEHDMTEIEAHRQQVEAEMRRQHGDAAVDHGIRFRKVSTRYPHVVAQAYGGDIERAAADSDEDVAARVAIWEQAQGLPLIDWHAIGAEERDELDEETPPA